MRRLKNHKGAALVSVMIAITFISIVATTLLLISLNNYQMKVVNSQSKENFYETEQRLNVATANVRDNIYNSTNVTGELRTLLGGVTTADDYTHDSYSGSKIAELAFPNASSDPATSITGSTVSVIRNPGESDPANWLIDKYYFYDGTFDVEERTSGKEITVNDVKVKQINAEGYENTIKTDIKFYVQMSSSGSSSGGGIGSCSFILDSCMQISCGHWSSDKSTRINIYGNTIMGQYDFNDGSDTSTAYTTSFLNGSEVNSVLSKYSYPRRLSWASATKITNTDANKEKATIYLTDTSTINYLGDNNVVLGDIYIDDKSIINVLRGNFTCYGNIFVNKNAAFICEGVLSLGPNNHIYSVDSGNCTAITTSTPAKNIIFSGSIVQLDKLNYDKMCDHLKLFNDKQEDDGILPNIMVKASPVTGTTISNANKDNNSLNTGDVDPMYIYDLDNAYHDYSNTLCTFDGISYKAAVPEGDLNANYENELIIINSNINSDPEWKNARLVANVPGSTIISEIPVVTYDTHGVCVSKMGDQAFNYILENDCRMNFKSKQGSKLKQYKISDFFDTDAVGGDCNSFVSTVFNLSTGGDTTGGPSVPTKTAISYTNWAKDVKVD